MVLGVIDVAVVKYWLHKSPRARASRLQFPIHLLFQREQDPAVERARRRAMFATGAAVALGWAILLIGSLGGFNP